MTYDKKAVSMPDADSGPMPTMGGAAPTKCPPSSSLDVRSIDLYQTGPNPTTTPDINYAAPSNTNPPVADKIYPYPTLAFIDVLDVFDFYLPLFYNDTPQAPDTMI